MTSPTITRLVKPDKCNCLSGSEDDFDGSEWQPGDSDAALFFSEHSFASRENADKAPAHIKFAFSCAIHRKRTAI